MSRLFDRNDLLIDHLLVHAVEFDKATLRLLRISQIDNRPKTVKR